MAAVAAPLPLPQPVPLEVPCASSCLIVFDWDDSLCASRWVQEHGLLAYADYASLPENAREELEALEDSVVRCLTTAQKYGSLIIITNAEDGWVQLSARRFFRRLSALLRDVPTVSARTNFEARFPNQPLSWKAAATAYVLHQKFCQDFYSPKTVLSIGDSDDEHTAMRIAARQHSCITTKTIKLVADPRPSEIVFQLDWLCANLEHIMAHKSDLSCNLESLLPSRGANRAAAGATTTATLAAAAAAASALPEQGQAAAAAVLSSVSCAATSSLRGGPADQGEQNEAEASPADAAAGAAPIA